jgi:hypothetical protein
LNVGLTLQQTYAHFTPFSALLELREGFLARVKFPECGRVTLPTQSLLKNLSPKMQA